MAHEVKLKPPAPVPPNDMTKPVLPGKGASDYERYLRTDELLALQKNADQLLHPDELERARGHIAAAEYRDACRLLRRANHMLDHPVALLHVLETITPYDYHKIRVGLGHGSGLDSPGFLGLLHVGPRLGDAFFAQLEKAGLTPEEMYRRHAEFTGLHDTAECLLDFDERVQLFRFHHLKLAQRIIGGGVIGTMGTPVEVLKQRQEHIFYKQLWDVRNQITGLINEKMQKPTAGHS